MIGHTPHTVKMRDLVVALGTRRVQTDRQITADMLVEPLNDTITTMVIVTIIAKNSISGLITAERTLVFKLLSP